ncbi:MAG: hypothetical protein IJT08_01640, partial [Alphaproteobacteria bacterium]|nr:hypothetical protein [Alphaproteobacteria bacterium]
MKYPTSQRPGYRKDKSSGETRQGIHYAGTELGRNRNWDKMNSYKSRIGMEMAPKKAQRQNGDNTWSVSRNRDDTVDATTRWIQSQNTSGGTSRMNSQDVSGSRDGTKTQRQSLEKPDPGRCRGKAELEWTTTNVNHPDEQHQMQLPQRKIPGAELKKATAVEENLGCRRHFSEARRKERSLKTLHQVPL